ncbi:Lethal(3)malignant brain tumor-like protein 3 [Armadillidium vulgare]|nr:Lethal(3)malignant brain tumor-like protein 3 [Armadillidium vulgare]
MSENTGILQVPVAGKSADNDPQKLVYVHVPKNKDATLPTTFTLTKSTKLSGGSITFSSHSAPSSPTNKVRPPILGNKFTISPTIAKTATNISINSSKSIKVSLNNSRSIGGTSTPTVFRAANTGGSNLPSNFISQGPSIPLTSRSSTGVSQLRNPSIVSQVSTFKSQKPVLLQSKILSSLKGNSPKVVAQKMMPVSLTAKQTGKRSTLVSYGKILPSVVSNNNGNSIKNSNNGNKHDTTSLLSSGIKRDHYGAPKREGGCMNSFTPPPLILQSGSNAKKLGNKKTCPATISIVTGKSSSGSSGFNFYPLARNNTSSNSNCTITSTNKGTGSSLKNSSSGSNNSFCISQSSSSGNYKIMNGLVDVTSGSRDVNSSINKQMEQKDILQEAMTVSDLQEVTTDETVPHYRSNNDSSSSTVNVSSLPIPLVNTGLQNKNSQPLSDPIPIILSKNVAPGCPTPVLIQGTLPLPPSGTVPVTVHSMVPVKVQSSNNSSSSHFSSQMHMEKQTIPGLIIRTDTVTVRRKVPGISGKEEDRKESTKPDLSIIPILRNNANSSLNNTSVGMTPTGQTSVQCNSVDSVEVEHEKGHEDAKSVKKTLEENSSPFADDNKIAEVKELLKWENGTGSLIGSELKFKINEFNAVELVEDEALEDIRNQIGEFTKERQESPSNNECNKINNNISSNSNNNNNNTYSEAEVMPESQIGQDKTSSVPTHILSLTPTKTASNNPVHVHHARKPNLNNCRRDDESNESDAKNSESRSKGGKNVYDICCCKNCGCYGLSSEFLRSNENNFCTVACSEGKGTPRGSPLKLWSEPFPYGKNLFKTGMKLEGIDPQHQSLFCVMTVVDVLGHRIRLHFDGYSDMYDFWCNANSPNIFHTGWCEKNGRKLETPPGIYNFTLEGVFRALQSHRSSLRMHLQHPLLQRQKIGKNGWMCVATVSDVLDNRILVHFDGWDRAFDTWFEISSPFIHPVGWCSKNGVYLYPPKDYSNIESFNWHEYLQETNSTSVPARAFKTRLPKEFKVDMKLEAVDKRNPMLVRVATVLEVKSYKLLLHFDGWPDVYDFWVDDDSPDIHPPTWCSKSGHPLQSPLTPEQCAEDVDSGVGCGTQGCKGYGHVKGLIYNTHHTAYGCPYSLQNLHKDWEALLPDRLEPPKEKKKGKNATKNFINLDASKPVPEESDESQKKRRLPIQIPRALKRLFINPYLIQVTIPIHHHLFHTQVDTHRHIVASANAANRLDIERWRPDDVCNAISKIPGCEISSLKFMEQEIDGEALLLLTQNDLVSMLGIKLGPAIKIMSFVFSLRRAKDTSPSVVIIFSRLEIINMRYV